MKLFQKSLCNVMSIYDKVKSRQRTQLQKFYQRSYIVISSDLCAAIKKILDKNLCHSHLKVLFINQVLPEKVLQATLE